MKEFISLLLLWLTYKLVRFIWKSLKSKIKGVEAGLHLSQPATPSMKPNSVSQLSSESSSASLSTRGAYALSEEVTVESVSSAEQIPPPSTSQSEPQDDSAILSQLIKITITENGVPVIPERPDRKGSIKELRLATPLDRFWPHERGESSRYTHDTGIKRKEALNLTEEEVRWLNEVRYWENDRAFYSQDFQDLVYRLYLCLCNDLNTFTLRGKFEEALMQEAFASLDDWSLRTQSYRNSAIDFLRNDTCNLISTIARSALRAQYLKTEWSLPYEVSSSNNKLIDWEKLGQHALVLIPTLPVLSDEGFINLFEERDSLWKKYWMQWGPSIPKKKVLWLWEVCKKSQYVHNVYYEGANELALIDEKELALYGYAMHVVTAKRVAVKPKALSKQSREKLFVDKASATDWMTFFDALTSRENSKKIQEKVHLKLYPPPKKVSLNTRKLSKIEKDHNKTAKTLEAILSKGEESDGQESGKQPAVVPPAQVASTVPQADFLRLVVSATDGVDKTTLSEFARKSSTFPSKVLDEVNEYFFERAGEPVILEEGEKVVLCEDYRSLVEEHLQTNVS
jgi:hypothetical protein